MKVVLAGYLETALIRRVDEIFRPTFNSSVDSYDICLHRKVPRSYFDQAATLLAIADATIVPPSDWHYYGLHPGSRTEEDSLGIEALGNGSIDRYAGDRLKIEREWNPDIGVLCKILLSRGALSASSILHISNVDLRGLDQNNLRNIPNRQKSVYGEVALHYLRRLLLQVNSAREHSAHIAISEADLKILEEVGGFIKANRLATPFDLPDVTDSSMLTEEFASGLLNFSPPDIQSVEAVRQDDVVRLYADRVKQFFSLDQKGDAEIEMLRAMKNAYEKSERGRRAERVFEVVGWIAKPLHYVPGLGEGLSLAEDVKDVLSHWMKREIADEEWFFLGVKMAEVATKDFLARAHNRISL